MIGVELTYGLGTDDGQVGKIVVWCLSDAGARHPRLTTPQILLDGLLECISIPRALLNIRQIFECLNGGLGTNPGYATCNCVDADRDDDTQALYHPKHRH